MRTTGTDSLVLVGHKNGTSTEEGEHGSFQDRANEMLPSDDIILVAGEGRPLGLCVPWGAPELSEAVGRELFARLTEQIAGAREALGLTEEDVLADFASGRRGYR